ncbi:hypothetical protein L9F63_002629, partial [Diploptera punctata]
IADFSISQFLIFLKCSLTKFINWCQSNVVFVKYVLKFPMYYWMGRTFFKIFSYSFLKFSPFIGTFINLYKRLLNIACL